MKINTLLSKIKHFLGCVVIIGASVVLILSSINKHKIAENSSIQHKNEVKIEQIVTDKEIEERKIDLNQAKIDRANTFITSINTDTQLICTTINGNYNSKYQRKSDDEFVFFNNASIEMVNSFVCKVGIYTSDIHFSVQNNGNVSISYNKNAIQVLSTEITNTTYTDDKDIFGKAYDKKDMVAIIENNTQNIKDYVLSNDEYMSNAEKSLQQYYTSLAKDMGVYSVSFNNGTTSIVTPSYKFKNATNVKYGHNNEPLNDIQYIVLHSTANPNMTAEDHINWLNNYNATGQNSTHFYCDDEYVVQALNLHTKGWHTGNDYNDISIGIEICEFTDIDKQERALQNTKELVHILKQMYPNAKVVTHKMVSSYSKNCPTIVYGKNAILTEDEFFKIMLE